MAAVTQESVVEDITSLLSVSDADERIRMIEELKGVSTRWLHLYLGWYKWRRCFRKDPGMAAEQIVNGNYRNTWRSLRKLGSPFRDAFMNPLKS